MASVAVAAVWSTLWGTISYYTDPDPAGESVIVVVMTILFLIEYALLIGLGAGGGALYRRLRARGTPPS